MMTVQIFIDRIDQITCSLNYTCHSIRVGTNQIIRNTVTVQHCTAADVCLFTWTDKHPKHCNSVTVSVTYYLISTDSNRVACIYKFLVSNNKCNAVVCRTCYLLHFVLLNGKIYITMKATFKGDLINITRKQLSKCLVF